MSEAEFRRALQTCEPGLVRLASGREVWWTGRVAIGLRHAAPPRDIGTEAERVQTLLLSGRWGDCQKQSGTPS